MIVFGQIPGTKNRTRVTVSPDLSFDPVRGHLAIKGGEGTINDNGPKLRSDGNTRFDNWKFSRGLHRIALGVLALRTGATVALERRYDIARTYVRSPQGRSEFRTYLQRPTDRLLGNHSMPIAIRDQGYKYGFWELDGVLYFYLHLFVSEFIVSFWGDPKYLSDGNRDWIAASSCPLGTTLSKRDWLTFERAGDGRRVELSPHPPG